MYVNHRWIEAAQDRGWWRCLGRPIFISGGILADYDDDDDNSNKQTTRRLFDNYWFNSFWMCRAQLEGISFIQIKAKHFYQKCAIINFLYRILRLIYFGSIGAFVSEMRSWI